MTLSHGGFLSRRHFAAGLAAAAAYTNGTAFAQPPLPLAKAADEGFAPDLPRRLRAAMQAHIDAGILPGVMLLVARHGHIVAEQALGWRNIERREPMAPDTIFRLYSSTKPFTAVTALSLIDDGSIDLDAPVSDYLPAFANLRVYVSGDGDHMVTEPLRRPMTVRDLFSQRSGLTYGGFGDSPVHQRLQEVGVGMGPLGSLKDFVDKLVTVPLLFQPGERWEYGLSLDVIGYLVQVVGGKPFDVVMEERVLAPLGLTDTTFSVMQAKRHRLATGYVLRDNGKLEVAPRGRVLRTAPEGGAGLFSTVGDFARFAQMLCNGGELEGHRILKPETVAMINVNQVPAGGPAYGLGVGIESDPDAVKTRGSVGSYGWSGAGQVHFWVDPEEQIIGIFLTQCLPFTIDRDTEMRSIVYGALKDAARG